MQQITLVVMAAGKGSRFGGLKQIEPVGPSGEAIIDYSIYDAIRAGFSRIVFVIRSDIDGSFRSFMGEKLAGRVDVEYVYQDQPITESETDVISKRTKPWGTAHAVLAAASKIPGPFAIINGDDFYGRSSFKAIFEYLESGAEEICMVGFDLAKTLSDFGSVKRGLCLLNDEQRLEEIVEVEGIVQAGDFLAYAPNDAYQESLIGNEVVSMNMWGMRTIILDLIRQDWQDFIAKNRNSSTAEFYLPTAINKILSNNHANCHVLRTADEWFGITYREDKPLVSEKLARLVAIGDYPKSLWADVIITP